jgi:anti-anti-sigma factor
MSTFSVDREIRDQVVVVSLAGELTAQTRDLLHPLLEQIAAAPGELVIMNMERLDHLDHGGVAAVVLAQRLLTGAGAEMVIANANGQPEQALAGALLTESIAIHAAATPRHPWTTPGVSPAMVLFELFEDDEDAMVTGTLRDTARADADLV